VSKVSISIHDLPREVYDNLDITEESVATDSDVAWKVISTPTAEVCIFRRSYVPNPGWEYPVVDQLNDALTL